MDYAVVNILDYMELIGEESVVDVLSGFSCPKNKEIENFVRNNAVEFAKRKMSITYLLLDESSRVLAIFAITHKAVQIFGTNLSATLQKKIQRYAQKNEKTDEYALSAFLIGQFGKNYQHKERTRSRWRKADGSSIDHSQACTAGNRWWRCILRV